jgi:hypothetical protein
MIFIRYNTYRLSWYEHVMRREENHVTRRVMNMNVEGWRGRS